jgi:hypothetical protein
MTLDVAVTAKPAAKFVWYINDKKLSERDVQIEQIASNR